MPVSNRKLYTPEPASAPGDFYNVEGECVSCGVPHSVAPDLVGWKDDGRGTCYWIKQPETPGELERAFLIFDGQEVGCHRYAGTDPLIQIRIGSGNCDNPVGVDEDMLFSLKSQARQIGNSFSAHWGETGADDLGRPSRKTLLRRMWDRIANRR